MCQENDVSMAASSGPVRAIRITPSPARKARRARGRGTRPRARRTRASADTYAAAIARTTKTTGSANANTRVLLDHDHILGNRRPREAVDDRQIDPERGPVADPALHVD